jgi:exodeoxyribonuclease V alpha subunit
VAEAEQSLDGTLERVTFRGDEYYTVARFQPDGGAPITIVGKLVEITEGMPITVHGQWVDDKKYGRQFKVSFAHPRTPKTVLGIERFLGSGLIPGVGPAIAKRIVEKFGKDTLDVIDKTPMRLTEIVGIGSARAKKVAEAVAAQRHVQEVMVFLQGHGVTIASAARIVKRYGRDAINVVRANPYRLAHEVWGIGFRTALRRSSRKAVESRAARSGGLNQRLQIDRPSGRVLHALKPIA